MLEKMKKEEIKELLLEELYEFVLKHEEIQINHSLYGKNIIHVKIGLNIYECDKSHLNSYIAGYKAALENID